MAETDETLTALDVLRRDGWCKHHTQSASGEVCLLGAIDAARGLDPRRAMRRMGAGSTRVGRAIRAVIREQFPDRDLNLWRFNDHPDTTFADVELVLEKAQLRLDEVTADV